MDAARDGELPAPILLSALDFAAEAMHAVEGPPDDRLLDRMVRLLDSDALPRNDEALLSIILVSHGPEDGQSSVDQVLGRLSERKGFRGDFRVSAISGGLRGCLRAPAAPRLVELANRSGGVEESVCTADWSRTLENLSQRAFGFKTRKFLSRRPVIESLVVEIDGQRLSRTEPSDSSTGATTTARCP